MGILRSFLRCFSVGAKGDPSEPISLTGVQVAGTGFELPADSTGKTSIPDQGGAECDAVGEQNGAADPELREVSRAWPTLSNAIKSDILELIRAADGTC